MSRALLYQKVGEALHLGQALELQVRVLISILNDNFDSDIGINGLVLEEDKRTLGRLIKELKKHSSIDDAGCDVLKVALRKRNYIAHDFFNKNVFAFSDNDFQHQVLEKLEEDTKDIATATAMIQGFLEGFCNVLNIDINGVLIEQSI